MHGLSSGKGYVIMYRKKLKISCIDLGWGPIIDNKLLYVELSTSDQRNNKLINPNLQIENRKDSANSKEDISIETTIINSFKFALFESIDSNLNL